MVFINSVAGHEFKEWLIKFKIPYEIWVIFWRVFFPPFNRAECFTMAWEIPWHEIQKELPILWKSKDMMENIYPVPDIPLIAFF